MHAQGRHELIMLEFLEYIAVQETLPFRPCVYHGNVFGALSG